MGADLDGGVLVALVAGKVLRALLDDRADLDRRLDHLRPVCERIDGGE